MSKDEPQEKNGNGNGIFIKFIIGVVGSLVVLGIAAALAFSMQTNAAVAQLTVTKAETTDNSKMHSDIEVRLRILEESFRKFDSKLDKIDGKLDDIHKNSTAKL